MSTPAKTVQLRVRLSRAVAKQVKIAAADAGIPMGDLIRQLLTKALDKGGK